MGWEGSFAAVLGSARPVLAGAPGPKAPGYVNIPASPSSWKQLHYLGLELQETSAEVRGASRWIGGGAPPLSLSCVLLGGAPSPHTLSWSLLGGPGSVGSLRLAHLGLLSGAGMSHYAQIDLAATAAAHRAGSQHAQAREERLAELQPRRKGTPR